MLSTELTNFQNNLKDLIKNSSEKAATEAFIKSLEKPTKLELYENNDNYEKIKEENAEAFGKVFGDVFSKEISTDLAKLIMDYIKSAKIEITHIPTNLSSPAGLVTGTLTITPATSSIQIL